MPTIAPEPMMAVKVCTNRILWPRKNSSAPVIKLTKANSVKAVWKVLIVELIRRLKVEVNTRRKKDLGRICGPCLSKHISQKALIRLLIFLTPQLMSANQLVPNRVWT